MLIGKSSAPHPPPKPDQQTIAKPCQTCQKHPQTILQGSPTDPHWTPKRTESIAESWQTIPKLFPNDAQTVPKHPPNKSKRIPNQPQKGTQAIEFCLKPGNNLLCNTHNKRLSYVSTSNFIYLVKSQQMFIVESKTSPTTPYATRKHALQLKKQWSPPY